MITFDTEYRVCYGDTDMMGIMYYGNYPRLFEIGRNDFIRTLYKSYKEIEADGWMLPVSALEVKYKKSAEYEDLLTIRTIVKNAPKVRFEIETEIYNQKGELLTWGKTTLAFVDRNTKRPCVAPEELVQIIEKGKKS